MSEHRVARLAELDENSPTSADAGETKVVLVRRGDKVFALAGLCPHRGVPLSKGAVVDDRIVCGVHRASFALETGELLSPPACENLARYEVRIDDGDVLVTVRDDQAAHPVPTMDTRGDDVRHVVVVGNGAAGWRAAETLRREGFTGRVSVVAGDDPRPYDRTDLSKGFLGTDGEGEPRLLRKASLIEAADIDVLRATATGLDVDSKTLSLDDGDDLDYDALIIATGSDARRLDVPGAQLDGVHVLRTLEDALALRASLGRRVSPRVVIIGAGFIGLEAAASIGSRDAAAISVVMRDASPMASRFGEAFAARLQREHESAGVVFHARADVAHIDGIDGRVSGVTLTGGGTLEADVVLMAAGAIPPNGVATVRAQRRRRYRCRRATCR